MFAGQMVEWGETEAVIADARRQMEGERLYLPPEART